MEEKKREESLRQKAGHPVRAITVCIEEKKEAEPWEDLIGASWLLSDEE